MAELDILIQVEAEMMQVVLAVVALEQQDQVVALDQEALVVQEPHQLSQVQLCFMVVEEEVQLMYLVLQQLAA